MKTIVRKDEQAVSPVIATILMVAITVVLAAVLYVMVSGLITGPGNAPQRIGGVVSRSSDGTNWIITFTTVPTTSLVNTTVFISVTTSSGGTAFASTALSAAATLQAAKITYVPATTNSATLGANDRILLTIATYPAGDQITLTSGGNILYGPQTLQ